MVSVFPKSANQRKEMALTVSNSVFRMLFSLDGDLEMVQVYSTVGTLEPVRK